MKFLDILLVVFSILIWGISFSVVKLGISNLSPEIFNTLISAPIFLLLIFFKKPKKLSWLKIFYVAVGINVLEKLFNMLAIKSGLSLGITAVLIQTQSFFTLLFSIIFYKRIISIKYIFGLTTGIFGVSMIFWDTSNLKYRISSIIFVLFAACSWGLVNNLVKKVSAKLSFDLTLWSFIVSMPINFIICLFRLGLETTTHEILSVTYKTTACILFISVIAGLLATTIWYRLINLYSPMKISPFILLIPVFSTFFDILFFHASYSVLDYFGGAIIIIGLIVTQLPKSISEIILALRAFAWNGRAR